MMLQMYAIKLATSVGENLIKDYEQFNTLQASVKAWAKIIARNVLNYIIDITYFMALYVRKY